MIVLEVAFLAIFWTWVACAILFLRNTLMPRLPLTMTPESFGMAAETIRFPATDRLELEGWNIPGQPAQPWIILCHGLGSNRSDLLEIAAGLHRAGFNLFLFDFRGHGGSRGRTTSFGLTEQRDVEGALAALGQRGEIPAAPYGIYGISMGGSVALMVAAQDERLGAIAVDSPYTNLNSSISRHVHLMYPWLPRVPFDWMIAATYRMRFGLWPQQLSPEASAAQLGPRPLLLIQGGADPRMPPEEATRLFEQSSNPKELWVIPHAGHLEGYTMDPAAYVKRLVIFFESHLKRTR
ncbi:MAG: alpha/beta hydrolase [Candidatus Omnitrophica bacterium]|nr:alpha/beta hydrolase [Candidatus Omnitrophota bacterium]